MNIQLRAASLRAIKQALADKLQDFPDTNKGYNQSRPFRIALKEIERNELKRKNRPGSLHRAGAGTH